MQLYLWHGRYAGFSFVEITQVEDEKHVNKVSTFNHTALVLISTIYVKCTMKNVYIYCDVTLTLTSNLVVCFFMMCAMSAQHKTSALNIPLCSYN
jgi:hypothetical protein